MNVTEGAEKYLVLTDYGRQVFRANTEQEIENKIGRMAK